MRVGVSAYLMHDGASYRAAGVSTYTTQLLTHLPRVNANHEYIAFYGSDGPVIPNVTPVISPLSTYRPLVRIPWEQSVLPLQALRRGVEVLHGTVNVVPLLSRIPTVVTVHDLSFLRFPERFPGPKRVYLRAAVEASAKRATRVIAVSQNTRDDIIEFFGVPAQRISVVYSGVMGSFHVLDPECVSRFRQQTFGHRPYILHVGTLEPRKNIDILIEAFNGVRQRMDVPHVLALVGARGWMYEQLFDRVSGLGLEDHVRFMDYVHPQDLPLWYNGADLFVYPSAYEGFGLPLLEAMACGVPCITSTSGALRELASDACLTAQVGSREALEVAIARVLDDDGLRRTMSTAGLQRASGFSWENCARQTLMVYDFARGDAQR